MRAPLWLDIKMQGKGPNATVSLAKCRNCGQVKATTTPCGFDHLAAVMEFGAYISSAPATESGQA